MKLRAYLIALYFHKANLIKQVSVIVPVYNNPGGLQALLQSLLNQSYPRENLEIIVIDNGSTDETLSVARKCKSANQNQIQVLVENTIRGSYAARNKGIRQAQGEIVALIDSDCVPIREWIERGAAALDGQRADLIGGQVKFTFSSSASPAEMYDAMTHMQMQRAVEDHGTSPTANLFIRREVFDQIGLFPSAWKSGADMIWTRRATDAGFKLRYAAEALVMHPARGLRELLKKKYRVAGGQVLIWQANGMSMAGAARKVWRYLFPPRMRSIRNLIDERGTAEMKQRLWAIWAIAWLCRYATNLGRIQTFLQGNPRET